MARLNAAVIKILHTADWHLGATLQGWSRETNRKALAQIVGIAKTREVDAIIVAGDIFDSLNPSADAQRLLFETLKDLRAVRPNAIIALVAGNHDPAGRLEAPRALFDLIGVVAVGTIGRREREIDTGVHLTPLRDSRGARRRASSARALPARKRSSAGDRRHRRFARRVEGARVLSRNDRGGAARDSPTR